MRAMWQMWPGAVPEHLIQSIINEGNNYPIANLGLGFDGTTQNTDYRQSDVRWINKTNESSRFISDVLWYYAQLANRNAFGFDIDFINDIQYTTYRSDNNGKYDWHSDIFWGNPTEYDRKISMVIQLTDPSEYDGGVFEIDAQYQSPNPEELKRKGTVLAFPSFLLHRVTPVTRGIRQSLVSWIEGPKFR